MENKFKLLCARLLLANLNFRVKLVEFKVVMYH